jgi:hypothetical protein
VLHTAIAALDTRAVNFSWNLPDLTQHIIEIVEGRSFTHRMYMSQKSSITLGVMRNELEAPEDDACQKWHGGNEDIERC